MSDMSKSLSMLLATLLMMAVSASERPSMTFSGSWPVEKVEWGDSNVVWRTFKAKVPADWNGRRIRIEIPGALYKCDAVVYVNGKRAGDILRPGFDGVDATHLVKLGEENEVRFCVTESGAETARGATKAVTRVHFAKKGPSAVRPRLTAYPVAFISDVFANTSWRKKRCDFEVEVDGDEDLTQRRRDAELSIKVFDSSANLVWRGVEKIAITNGINRAVVSMPWNEKIVAWELGRPALYTAQVSLCDAASLHDEESVRFGFREVWREGREIMMNGHKVHFRPTYTYYAGKWGLKFLQDIGFNVGFWGHSVESTGFARMEIYDACDELGMGMYASMGAQDTIGAGAFHRDAALMAEFKRFARVQQRLVRNHPALLVGIVSQMTICSIDTAPDQLGQRLVSGDRVDQIEQACRIHRSMNPNILYISHADGACGDIASANLYLNFTPSQEREEWLCQWTTNGILPWCSIEFDPPYNGNFWKRGVFLPTEFLAMYYGDRAYAEESPKTLAHMVGSTLWRHNGLMKGDLLYKELPLYWDLRRTWTRRTNERWRAYGLNGGNIWFNCTKAYGTPPGEKSIYWRYYNIKKEIIGRPAWANEEYDIHRLGNLDFCAFIGGAPEFVDCTHAYYAGEKVGKQLVFIWDGVGAKDFQAAWSVVAADGRRLAGGVETARVAQGEQVRVPVSFRAPEVEKKLSATIHVSFSGEGVEPIADEMKVEIRPRFRRPVCGGNASVALLDTDGTASQMLKSLGIEFRAISSPGEVCSSDTHLVVGRDALTDHKIDALAPLVKAGLRVFILRQTPDVWRRFGFHVQDVMSRKLFLRDISDPAFSEIAADDLSCWRGAPDYPNGPFGSVMRHATQRGPRGTRRHTVAGILLQTPERIGYTPVVVGGYDMDYSALLRFAPGGACRGDVIYCTLDFEGRMGVCPAATAVANAVFASFLSPAASGHGGTLIVCDEDKARAAGFDIGSETTVYSAAVPEDLAFRGVGPNDLRWPTGLKARRLTGVGATSDGLFAFRREGGRTVVYSQIPTNLVETAKPADSSMDEVAAERANAECLDASKLRRLYARLATNLGIGTTATERDKALRRALHQTGLSLFKPLPAVHVLGPFVAGKDNSKLMLDNVWSEQGESMAISGDFNPNIEFPLPQGGTANWRPMLVPTDDGVYDFGTLFPLASFPVAYATCTVPRAKGGRALLRFGMDWRAKIWCNGHEVFRSESGATRTPRFEVMLPLKKGENVLAFKVGAGKMGFKMTGLLESEATAGEPPPDPEIDSVTLYGASVPGFDPWEFVYW